MSKSTLFLFATAADATDTLGGSALRRPLLSGGRRQYQSHHSVGYVGGPRTKGADRKGFFPVDLDLDGQFPSSSSSDDGRYGSAPASPIGSERPDSEDLSSLASDESEHRDGRQIREEFRRNGGPAAVITGRLRTNSPVFDDGNVGLHLSADSEGSQDDHDSRNRASIGDEHGHDEVELFFDSKGVSHSYPPPSFGNRADRRPGSALSLSIPNSSDMSDEQTGSERRGKGHTTRKTFPPAAGRRGDIESFTVLEKHPAFPGATLSVGSLPPYLSDMVPTSDSTSYFDIGYMVVSFQIGDRVFFGPARYNDFKELRSMLSTAVMESYSVVPSGDELFPDLPDADITINPLGIEGFTPPRAENFNHGGFMQISLTADDDSFTYPARYNDFDNLRTSFIANGIDARLVNQGFPRGFRNAFTPWKDSWKTTRQGKLNQWLNRMLSITDQDLQVKIKFDFQNWFAGLGETYLHDQRFAQSVFGQNLHTASAVRTSLQSWMRSVLEHENGYVLYVLRNTFEDWFKGLQQKYIKSLNARDQYVRFTPPVQAFPTTIISVQNLRNAEYETTSEVSLAFLPEKGLADTTFKASAKYSDFQELRASFSTVPNLDIDNLSKNFPQKDDSISFHVWLNHVLTHTDPAVVKELKTKFEDWFATLQVKYNAGLRLKTSRFWRQEQTEF